MKRLTGLNQLLVVASVLVFAGLTHGQIDITKTTRPGEEKPIWVSLTGFSGEAAEVIRFDLYVQGFNFTNAEAAQFLISGSNDGNLTGRVTDRFNNATKLNKSYSGATLRRQAHAFVDDFLQSIERKGIGQTRIAYKVDTGANAEIYVADFDGHSAQAITQDNALVAAPAWVPGRLALYYTSYMRGSPHIYYHDVAARQRRVFADYPGSNISPAVSPDGSRVAMILSKDGATDLYVANSDGTNLRRLTKSREDESSPCWSPDGQWICFAARLEGRRSLFKVPAAGGPMQRINTAGVSSPTEPDWSPDGRWIVFTRQARDFEICVVPAQGGEARILVSGEDPSWAPNSRTVVYARRSGGSRRLSLLDVPTKQYKDVSRISGSSSQPSWAR
ncbi:MAG: PD40 domain-containing protein [Verrucomicrobiae bacterium]|nr:PD40 domain-containing protein [Verrucomicrobiae bacterium]